ncbi:hypothetical protein [Pseudochrobactrum sp. HB0163]|uniref:hypothetical protein n=1 Tax=Pseudochrobactrum sp. HB0163 TaxID=3450708 RepID=UPI003F6E0422
MFQSYTSRSFIRLSFVLLLINAIVFYCVTDLNNLAAEMGEEGLLENLQLVYLGLAALAFFVAGLRDEGPERMFAIGMCVLMLIFFFRELEVEPDGLLTGYIKSRAFRWHEAFVVIAVAAFYIFRHKNYVRPVMHFILSGKAWPFYLAAMLLLLGEVFERMDGFAYNEFLEEVFESLSYFLLLCLGVRSIICARATHNSIPA